MVGAALRGMENLGQGRTVLGLVTSIPEEVALEFLDSRVERSTTLVFNPERRAIRRVELIRFDGHEIKRSEGRPAVDETVDAAEMLRLTVESDGLAIPGWDAGIDHWITRVRCVAEWCPERNLPAYDPDDLAVVRAEVLGGATRLSEVQRDAVGEIVRNALNWEDRQFVERMAPERISLPGGGTMRIEYREGEQPCGRARIQQLFGMEETPAVAAGRVRVLLEILAPNQRPVQRTNDLASFWARTYPELRKELRRRYPKHEWP